jgi:PAS domain S-box-containing protein
LQNQGFVSESQVIGKTDFEIFPERLALKFSGLDQRVFDTGKAVLDHKEEYIFEDNQEHWLFSSKYPLRNEQNELIGLVGISRDITQKIQAEQKIIQLSKGVEQSPASIVITNLDGDIEYVNSKFISLTGYAFEEVRGKNPRILSSGEKSTDEYKVLWDTISHGDEWKGEFHNKKKNGELYWESAIISPIRDEQGTIHSYIAIKEDITQRKQTEQQLLKLNAGMNQSPASIMIINTEGIIEYVNKKFLETSGYDEVELIGRMLRILKTGHTSPEVYDEIWKSLNDGIEWRGEHLNRRKNMESYWESVLISPIKNSSNKIINFIVISEDISLRKKLEADLMNAKEKAEESDRLKSAFLNNMSHEIRTPLNAIVGFTELFSNNEISNDERAYFYGIIQNSSDQLLHIITDIINVSTIDAGQISSNLAPFNVNDLLVTLYEQFQISNSNKDVKITYVSTLNDEEAKIITDETKLTQVISNLIVNALKFTSKGLVEYGVKTEGKQLYFWVKDSGIGISKEFQEIIFDRFRQADSSINKLYGGSGLGLSIAKSFVQLLGGEIGVKSEVDKGAEFYFYHPYNKA